MTRWKAGLIHLALSIPVVVCAVLAMTLIWYPPPFFLASGGGHLILILAAVDLVIGPCLTVLVYRAGKPSLKWDLAVIALIQAGALLYGTHSIFLARPAFVVFAINQFEVVTAADIPPEEQAKASESRFRYSPLRRFAVVAVILPASEAERERVLFASLAGHDLSHFPQHYVAFESQRAEVVLRSKPLSELLKHNPGRENEITAWLAKSGYAEDRIGFVPVRALKRDLTAFIALDSGQVLSFAPFQPW